MKRLGNGDPAHIGNGSGDSFLHAAVDRRDDQILDKKRNRSDRDIVLKAGIIMHGESDLILCELPLERGLDHLQDAPQAAVVLLRIESDIDHAKKIPRRFRFKIITQVNRDA